MLPSMPSRISNVTQTCQDSLTLTESTVMPQMEQIVTAKTGTRAVKEWMEQQAPHADGGKQHS